MRIRVFEINILTCVETLPNLYVWRGEGAGMKLPESEEFETLTNLYHLHDMDKHSKITKLLTLSPSFCFNEATPHVWPHNLHT